jgi:hypothetical protein
MKIRTLVLFVLLGLLACCGILLGGVFALLHSPWLLNRLAGAFGYDVRAQALAFSPNLSGSISDLSITRRGDDAFALRAMDVTATNSFDRLLHGEIDSLVLQNPKLAFRIGKATGASSDLSFLDKLPNIRLLDIRNAEALFTFEGLRRQVRLTNGHLTLTNYSSKTGGGVAFRTHFAVTTGGEQAIAASGTLKGSFQLTAAYPRPYGQGTLELAVDSGKYTIDGRTRSLGGLALVASLAYDQPSDTLAITILRGESPSLGSITGGAKAVLRGEVPWSANLSVATIDLAQVFALLGPFLPEAYRTWSMQGVGAADAHLQGTYANDRLAFTGTLTFSFSQGGFSSPDGTTAAQGVGGRLVLKLRYAAPDQKLAFTLDSEHRDGEYLWGAYYTNLAGRQAALAADGALSWGSDRHAWLNGSVDIFQTGAYSFTAGTRAGDWAVQLRVADASHAQLVATFLRDFLRGVSPALAHLSVTGTSSLEASIRREGSATAITGSYRMTGTALDVPDLPLAIRELALDLPFDLRYPPPGARRAPSRSVGAIRVQALRANSLAIDSLAIPLWVTQNRLEVPEPVVIPFFGGALHLDAMQVDDLLVPARSRVGVKVTGADLGRLTRALIGTEYPGVLNADFGVMRYEQNRIASEGSAVIGLFGGEIEATDLFVENVASPGRKIGGDFTFRNINLEEVTRKVGFGKMTGIIQGALRNLVVEYGQPAQFDLEIRSVAAPGVGQSISLEAIQHISILGTGTGSALNRGITRFFKEYPYSRIGFRCILNNDQFSVNGTIHEGGREYLVRRGFLRGVDVINQNPENVISFKDMQERLGRIFRSPQAGISGSQGEYGAPRP